MQASLIALRNTGQVRKVSVYEIEKKKSKLKKSKYNDNYNEVSSARLFDDISRYWTYLFNINWCVMDPDFNRDSICELISLKSRVKPQLYMVLLR